MALVENIEGLNGNKVVNQFVIKFGDNVYFQSYDSIIARIDRDGRISLSEHWDYSYTTRKYLYQFIRQYSFINRPTSKKAIEELIEEGVIKVDLNWRYVA